MGEPLLSLEGVVAGYGRGDILRGVNLQVERGSIVCLIGPNGAGKSTVLKTVSGLLRPTGGSVRLGDRSIGGLPPKAVLELGVVHVPQERSLFPSMSVWDNVLMGAHIVRDRRVVHRRVEEIAERFPIIARRRHDRAGALSGGEPELVLMDEPSTGLEPRARRQVFETIEEIGGSGATILLVEQNARSGLAIADRGAVMDGGLVQMEGTGAGLLDDPEVARMYLGRAGAASGRG